MSMSAVTCLDHGKVIQAFCATEQQLLCIDCIIQQQILHKTHVILSIEDASAHQANLLAQNLKKSQKVDSDIKNTINAMKAELLLAEDAAHAKRKGANELF
jgi:hypothetical protein